MKFFSNDAAKENEPEQTGDHVASEPVAVPHQRAGSPWSDAPGTADTEPADRDRRDGTDEPVPAEFDREPTVAGTVDAPAAGYHGAHASGAGVVEPQAAPAAVPVDLDRRDQPPADVERRDRATETGDPVLQDDGTFDGPRAVEPDTGRPIDAQRTAQDTAIRDEGTFDSPRVVDPATGNSMETPVPVAAPAPTPAPASAGTGRFFPDGDSFTDRFRDVQLRFVDSPKEATAEAAALIDEAVDKLAGALRAQKSSLAGGSDDTEQLRVELRGYRELLNRLLAL